MTKSFRVPPPPESNQQPDYLWRMIFAYPTFVGGALLALFWSEQFVKFLADRHFRLPIEFTMPYSLLTFVIGVIAAPVIAWTNLKMVVAFLGTAVIATLAITVYFTFLSPAA